VERRGTEDLKERGVKEIGLWVSDGHQAMLGTITKQFPTSAPKTQWKTIRTNNVMERLFGEVKRRSHKMAAAFRAEESCLLLFYAVIRSLKFNKLTMPTVPEAQPDLAVLHRT
jgi:transposase-like protein